LGWMQVVKATDRTIDESICNEPETVIVDGSAHGYRIYSPCSTTLTIQLTNLSALKHQNEIVDEILDREYQDLRIENTNLEFTEPKHRDRLESFFHKLATKTAYDKYHFMYFEYPDMTRLQKIESATSHLCSRVVPQKLRNFRSRKAKETNIALHTCNGNFIAATISIFSQSKIIPWVICLRCDIPSLDWIGNVNGPVDTEIYISLSNSTAKSTVLRQQIKQKVCLNIAWESEEMKDEICGRCRTRIDKEGHLIKNPNVRVITNIYAPTRGIANTNEVAISNPTPIH
ncbi:hypothetical protein NEHOM01_1571, partial [Nematocida homosporus]|uniref:uncharacterized protein n=1 Tax=Nematocida homosporus TaxID=1912981 RepID=UPI00221EA7F1